MALRISLTADAKKLFTFKVDCKELEGVLTRLSSVLSVSSVGAKNFIVAGVKGKVVVVAFNTDTYAYIVLSEATSSADGSFGFDFTHMIGLIKGRSTMEFSFTGGECTFKLVKGKYNGKFVVLPVLEEQLSSINNVFSSKDKGEDTVLSREVLDSLKEGLKLTGIKNVYSDAPLLSYISLNSKAQLTVSCFDQHHFGFYKASSVGAKGNTFKIALPNSHFAIIDKMVGTEDAKFYVKSESIRVEGASFSIVLPASQSEDKNFGMVPDYMSALGKPELSCRADLNKLNSMTDNLFTIYSANTSFDLSYKGGSSLDVTFTTNNGSGSDTLPVKDAKGNSFKVKVEPRVLRDTLSILQSCSDSEFNLVKQKCLYFSFEPRSKSSVTLVCALAG